MNVVGYIRVSTQGQAKDGYSLKLPLKLTKGRNKKAKEGGYAGGRATFGYTKQMGEKELKIHKGHAEVVKRYKTAYEVPIVKEKEVV